MERFEENAHNFAESPSTAIQKYRPVLLAEMAKVLEANHDCREAIRRVNEKDFRALAHGNVLLESDAYEQNDSEMPANLKHLLRALLLPAAHPLTREQTMSPDALAQIPNCVVAPFDWSWSDLQFLQKLLDVSVVDPTSLTRTVRILAQVTLGLSLSADDAFFLLQVVQCRRLPVDKKLSVQPTTFGELKLDGAYIPGGLDLSWSQFGRLNLNRINAGYSYVGLEGIAARTVICTHAWSGMIDVADARIGSLCILDHEGRDIWEHNTGMTSNRQVEVRQTGATLKEFNFDARVKVVGSLAVDAKAI